MDAFGIRWPLHRARTRDRAAPRVRPPAGGGALRWIFPVLCLAAPFLGEVAGIYLPSCCCSAPCWESGARTRPGPCGP